MKLDAGTIITCPNCETEQVKTTKDIGPGQQLKDAEFESMGHNMADINCFMCHTPWYRTNPTTKRKQIHTKDMKWVALGEPTKYEKKLII